jgi:hypothetical protein
VFNGLTSADHVTASRQPVEVLVARELVPSDFRDNQMEIWHTTFSHDAATDTADGIGAQLFNDVQVQTEVHQSANVNNVQTQTSGEVNLYRDAFTQIDVAAGKPSSEFSARLFRDVQVQTDFRHNAGLNTVRTQTSGEFNLLRDAIIQTDMDSDKLNRDIAARFFTDVQVQTEVRHTAVQKTVHTQTFGALNRSPQDAFSQTDACSTKLCLDVETETRGLWPPDYHDIDTQTQFQKLRANQTQTDVQPVVDKRSVESQVDNTLGGKENRDVNTQTELKTCHMTTSDCSAQTDEESASIVFLRHDAESQTTSLPQSWRPQVAVSDCQTQTVDVLPQVDRYRRRQKSSETQTGIQLRDSLVEVRDRQTQTSDDGYFTEARCDSFTESSDAQVQTDETFAASAQVASGLLWTTNEGAALVHPRDVGPLLMHRRGEWSQVLDSGDRSTDESKINKPAAAMTIGDDALCRQNDGLRMSKGVDARDTGRSEATFRQRYRLQSANGDQASDDGRDEEESTAAPAADSGRSRNETDESILIVLNDIRDRIRSSQYNAFQVKTADDVSECDF